MTANEQVRYNPRLLWFAVVAACFTFLLLGFGGLVTSHGAGMSVPGIFVLIAVSAWETCRWMGRKDALAKLAMFWLGLSVVQIFLGAATIWTHKAADVATAHVLGGALVLVVGAMLCVMAFGCSREMREMKPATISGLGLYGTATAMAANK